MKDAPIEFLDSQNAHPTAQGSGLVIRCMNVKFSPNLGDGLLTECLEAALVRDGAAPATSSVDLAARNGFGQGMTGRQTIMAGLGKLPDGLRNIVVRAPLALASRRRWLPHYLAGLEGADAVVIGGGHLLSDHDLNFPTKVALALRAARIRDLPVAIFGCGMSDSWSAEGERRMRRALKLGGLKAVFLRDDTSVERWNARFADLAGVKAQLVCDPGLLARDTYCAHAKQVGAAPVIGLGIMSHLAVRYHSKSRIESDALSRWYVDLARSLIGKGAHVIAFTNGAPEDRATFNDLKPALSELGVALKQPKSPAELSELAAQTDAMIAFRMHALIAAYSHAVPMIGLRWDEKVDAFFASVGRANWMIEPGVVSAEAAAERALQTVAEGVDVTRHDAAIATARADVTKLVTVLDNARQRADVGVA